ncbi:MAG: glutathione S-transferase N-terminal domain-containing protein [Xanthobacteraceae bacterium]
MILRSAPPSPFARKVRMAILMLGLADRVEIKPVDLNDPADPLRRENPLGKIPALVLDDGTTFYDSRVIVEYLDHLAGGDKLFPRDPAARFAQLRLQALCDGLLDAGVLIVYEGRYRRRRCMCRAGSIVRPARSRAALPRSSRSRRRSRRRSDR